MKESDWDEVMDTNLKGAWNFAKAALRTMLRQDTRRIDSQYLFNQRRSGNAGAIKLLSIESRNGGTNQSARERSGEPQGNG